MRPQRRATPLSAVEHESWRGHCVPELDVEGTPETGLNFLCLFKAEVDLLAVEADQTA